MGVGVGSGRVDEVPVPALVPLQVLSAGSIITPIYMPPTSPPLSSPRLCLVRACFAVLLHVQHDQAQTRETARAPGQRRLDGWVGFHV